MKLDHIYLIAIFTSWTLAKPRLRVVGGYTVNPPFKYNFIVPILRYDIYQCSGTLLTSNKVLTVAHCFSGARAKLNRYQAHVHRHNLDSSWREEGGRAYNISQRWIHPNYDEKSQYNDLAVVELKTKKSKKRLVNLDKRLDHTEGVVVTILGWGALKQDQAPSPILQEAKVPLNSQDRCERAYLNSEDYQIQSSHICAGGLGQRRDACSGDSGGPLFAMRKRKPVLIGVTSSGYACGHPTVPGIFMRVASYRPWILDVLHGKAEPTPYLPPVWERPVRVPLPTPPRFDPRPRPPPLLPRPNPTRRPPTPASSKPSPIVVHYEHRR